MRIAFLFPCSTFHVGGLTPLTPLHPWITYISRDALVEISRMAFHWDAKYLVRSYRVKIKSSNRQRFAKARRFLGP